MGINLFSSANSLTSIFQNAKILSRKIEENRLPKVSTTLLRGGTMAEGKRTISLAKIDNNTVLRLVAISPLVTAEALMETLLEVRYLANSVKKL